MYEKFEHYKTRNLKFTDIYKLVEPIRKLERRDLFGDHYFIKSTLKEYAGLPVDYEIKAFVEHAAQLSNFTELGFQVHPSLPSIVFSSFRVSVIEGVPGNHGAYAVGPIIAYAKSALPNDKLNVEKERLGKNLLVFPAHSVLGMKQLYDIDAFCRKIREIALDYDSVRVCLYWKDVLLGTAEEYKKYGFEVVTAGHYYDPMFMPRLKSIIQTSTMTMSNDLGTHVGYSIFLKKPHLLLKSELNVGKIRGDDKGLSERHIYAYKTVKKKIKNSDINLISRLLSKNQEFITEDQYNLMNKYWGYDQIKTPKQLRKLLLEIEGEYQLNNTNSQDNQVRKIRNQLTNLQLQNQLKNQLTAEKKFAVKLQTIRGYSGYKTKNLAERFKKRFLGI